MILVIYISGFRMFTDTITRQFPDGPLGIQLRGRMIEAVLVVPHIR